MAHRSLVLQLFSKIKLISRTKIFTEISLYFQKFSDVNICSAASFVKICLVFVQLSSHSDSSYDSFEMNADEGVDQLQTFVRVLEATKKGSDYSQERSIRVLVSPFIYFLSFSDSKVLIICLKALNYPSTSICLRRALKKPSYFSLNFDDFSFWEFREIIYFLFLVIFSSIYLSCSCCRYSHLSDSFFFLDILPICLFSICMQSFLTMSMLILSSGTNLESMFSLLKVCCGFCFPSLSLKQAIYLEIAFFFSSQSFNIFEYFYSIAFILWFSWFSQTPNTGVFLDYDFFMLSSILSFQSKIARCISWLSCFFGAIYGLFYYNTFLLFLTMQPYEDYRLRLDDIFVSTYFRRSNDDLRIQIELAIATRVALQA